MQEAPFEVEDKTHTVSLVTAIADYTTSYTVERESDLQAARHCLIDALGRVLEALRDPLCARLIGPLVPGALMPGGARVPGTSLELDPAQAAFCTGLMLCRWVGDSAWLSPLSGCAGDPFGAILATADYQARRATMEGTAPLKVRDVLVAFVKALEIQGTLSYGATGRSSIGDTTMRTARVAASAIVTAQLGGAREQIVTAVCYACLEGSMFLDAKERPEIGRGDVQRAESLARAVRYACQATAPGRPSFLTSSDLRAVHIAGGSISIGPKSPNRPLSTGMIGRLRREHTAKHAAKLATGFRTTVERYFPTRQAERIKALFAAPERLDDLPVNELLAALVTNGAR